RRGRDPIAGGTRIGARIEGECRSRRRPCVEREGQVSRRRVAVPIDRLHEHSVGAIGRAVQRQRGRELEVAAGADRQRLRRPAPPAAAAETAASPLCPYAAVPETVISLRVRMPAAGAVRLTDGGTLSVRTTVSCPTGAFFGLPGPMTSTGVEPKPTVNLNWN